MNKKGDIGRIVVISLIIALVLAFILFALFKGWTKNILELGEKIFSLG